MSDESDRQSRGRRATARPRDDLASADELLPDGLPFGRYRLLKRLSYGGMGEIYLAKHDGIGGFSKLLVIKRLLSHYRGDREVVAMFFDEAKLQALMNDRHIVQIWDMGKVDDQYFIAMEYVEGPSWRRLGERLREQRELLHPAHAVELVVQACRGLGYAHNLEGPDGNALSLVHRDVNPHNMLVTYGGEVKLIDFGIAKSEISGHHTETGTIKGKFAYMSPEQARAEPLDRRSDIFSLGICFYELLTGRNPFHRKNVVLSLEAICEAAPPPLEDVRPEAAALAPVIERCMAKNPDERFADCGEIEEALVSLYHDGLCGTPPETLGDLLARVFHDEIEQQSAFLRRHGFASLAAKRVGASDPGVPSPLARLGENTRKNLRRPTLSESQPSAARLSIESASPAGETQPTATIALSSLPPRSPARTPSLAPAPTPSVEDAAAADENIDDTPRDGIPLPALAAERGKRRSLLVAAGVGIALVVVGGAVLAFSLSRGGLGARAELPSGSGSDVVVATVEGVREVALGDAPVEQPAVERPAVDAPGDAGRPQAALVAEGDADPPASGTEADEERPDETLEGALVDAVAREGDTVDAAEDADLAAEPSVTAPEGSSRDRRGSKRRTGRETSREAPREATRESPRDRRADARATAVEAPAPVAAGVLTVNAGGPFSIESRGVRGRNVAKVSLAVGEARTITITGGPVEVRLRVSPSASGSDVRVESEPWTIVRANNIGRGRTPQSVRVERGGSVQLLLKNPAAGEMKVTLGLSG